MKIRTLILLLISTAGSVFSQNTKVSESIEKINDGAHPAFIVTVYECKPDEVEKAWKSLMKEYKSEKVSSRNGVSADNILIPSITDGTMDVYALADKMKENEVKFIVAFDMGGAYLSSALNNKMAYDAALKLISDFARTSTKNAIADKLKAAQKAFDKLKEQQKELEEKNADLVKDIENYKEKIHKAESDIATNKNDQEKKKAEIDAQRKVVDEIAIKEKNIN